MHTGLETGTFPGRRLGLATLVGALSHALDMTEGQPAGHALRCCHTGMAVGRGLGLPPDAMHDLYYALLLKDLGCSSNASRICSLYLTDDIAFKSDFKLMRGSLPAALRFVVSHTGLGAPLAERFAAVSNILRNGGTIARELVEARCERGGEIARRMRFGDGVADAIAGLDEHHDGGGKPRGLSGDAIPVASRIALAVQVLDVFAAVSGRKAALAEVAERSGSWFDPAVASALAAASREPGFWPPADPDALAEAVGALEPGRTAMVVDHDLMDDLAAGFAMVVDGKSPFTGSHSQRVAFYADIVAAEMGWGQSLRRRLRHASLVHDVGKLGVSNSILDKPGRLDDAEWAAMRAHASDSEAILRRVPGFEDLALVAGAHHERPDGTGYPRRLGSSDIPLSVRIVSVADVFDALTADRPYRDAMPVERALGIMRGDVGKAFDRRCVEALEAALARIGDVPAGAVRLAAAA